MLFDPFGDYETQGYLRNVIGEKDLGVIKHLEHQQFLARLDGVFDFLKNVGPLTYQQVLNTHQQLFGDLYPWAGHDRRATSPGLVITRGSVKFSHSDEIERAASYALQLGHDPKEMRKRPGEILGLLAYAHPFLDGNGRTIMVIHTELARRAGFRLDWPKTSKSDYLRLLAEEINAPKRQLEGYLKGLQIDWSTTDQPANILRNLPGLDGNAGEPNGHP